MSFQQLIGLLLPTGAIATIVMSFLGVSVFIECNITAEALRDFGDYLASGRFVLSSFRFPKGVIQLFERLFGLKHFSAKCILRSALFSAVGFLLVFALALLTSETFRSGLATMLFGHPGKANAIYAAVMNDYIVGWVFVALILDYLNLLKTRVLLNWLGTGLPKPVLIVISAVVLDVIANYCIFWGASLGIMTGAAYVMMGSPSAPMTTYAVSFLHHYVLVLSRWHQNFFPVGGSPEDILTSLLFYTALLPSIWLWMWVSATALTRLFARSARILRFLSYLMPLKHHPVRSIGILTGILWSAVYAVSLASFGGTH